MQEASLTDSGSNYKAHYHPVRYCTRQVLQRISNTLQSSQAAYQQKRQSDATLKNEPGVVSFGKLTRADSEEVENMLLGFGKTQQPQRESMEDFRQKLLRLEKNKSDLESKMREFE